MATKKGIAITAIVLGAITIASFFVWTIPQDTSQTISVSDFNSHLEGIENIHNILNEELDDSFQKLQEGEITSEEYVEMAEITSTQINSQIIQLVESKASEEWHESYINYIEALKTQNSIIRETIVIANTIESKGNSGVESSLTKIDELKSEMEVLVQASIQSKP